MNQKIIGRGTWYDKMAATIVEREERLSRPMSLIRTEMGLGASGLPHVGTLGDAARSYAVTLALREQNYNSKLIAFCDDMDGLRKVPVGLPKSLKKYLGFPVTAIPDPYKCHLSYGEHMSSKLLEALDQCEIDYEHISGKEAYETGLLNNEIATILLNAKRVGEIVKEEVGQERYVEVLPYFPICENCGRIYTTKTTEFLPKESKALYVCEGMEIKGQLIKGCHWKGEANVTKGEGKLSWKSEFAARWKALDIRFEAYGKDIADSVRINDRISREILHYEPPMHARYEMFLDKNGRKISKSEGNVLTPQTWFLYGTPQSLVLLMLKRFTGTRTLNVTDIPTYMNELDQLEDKYFGRKIVKDKRELSKLQGLYEYCWMLKPPKAPSIHVPYNLMTFLTKIAPKDNEEQYVTEKLRDYRYLAKNQTSDENLRKRIKYASNWVKDFEEIKETAVILNLKEKAVIRQLIEVLKVEDKAVAIQNTLFDAAKKQNLKPASIFQTLYTILLGVPRGPRLGPYILAMGKQNVIKSLRKALDNQ